MQEQLQAIRKTAQELMAFAGCTTMALTSILRDRFKRTIDDVKATAGGETAERHPKKFTHITLEIQLTSPDAQDEEVKQALQTAEDVICPVWAMLKGNVETRVSFTILRE